ncbi:hypothetical protein AB1N83_004361 [Pleurotus pulmonarius]|nr:hypothetical protein EYR38_009825 [Pleurotus pulmonarius]
MQLCAPKLLSLFMALSMSAMLVDASPVQANAAAGTKSLRVKQSRVPANAPISTKSLRAKRSTVPHTAVTTTSRSAKSKVPTSAVVTTTSSGAKKSPASSVPTSAAVVTTSSGVKKSPASSVPTSAAVTTTSSKATKSPVPSDAPVEKARECDCRSTAGGKEGEQYSGVVVQNALEQGLSLKKQGKTVGKNKYPHGYGNREALKFASCTNGLIEFPVLNRGSASGKAGTDRVVFDDKGNFCGCMTHLDVPRNLFRLCT